MTAHAQVVIGEEAADAMRRVGPSAWVVLLALALRAESDPGGGLVARVSARRLAVELGAARATIDRAVDALAAAAWVSPWSWRDPVSGRFVTEQRLSLPAGVHRTDLADEPPAAGGSTTQARRRHRDRPLATAPPTTTAMQLSLLDFDTAAD